MYADISQFEALMNAACHVRNDVQAGKGIKKYDPDMDPYWQPQPVRYDDLSESQQKQLSRIIQPEPAYLELSPDQLADTLTAIISLRSPSDRAKYCAAYEIPVEYATGFGNKIKSMFGGEAKRINAAADAKLVAVRDYALQFAEEILRRERKREAQRAQRALQRETQKYHEASDNLFRKQANRPKYPNPAALARQYASGTASRHATPNQWVSVEQAEDDLVKLGNYLTTQPRWRNDPALQEKVMNKVQRGIKHMLRTSSEGMIPYATLHNLLSSIRHTMTTEAASN